jgi:hypothetical protein
MLRAIHLALATILLLPLSTTAQPKPVPFDEFKKELMPRVGKKVSIAGVLESAKLGWLVVYNGWGVYIYSTRSTEEFKMGELNQFNQKTVWVTGTLHFFKGKKSASGPQEATVPDHFYFDVAEAKVDNQETKRSTVIKESVRKPLVVTAAPAVCLTAFRQLFTYLQNSQPSIVKDQQAQNKFLSKNLREALQKKVASFKDQPEDPDFPTNNTFIGSWDTPSTYTILGSRRYDKRVVIDIWYEWGKDTNYPGDTRLSNFIYVFEDGAWKLDDVYTFRGEYASAESLNFYLRSK